MVENNPFQGMPCTFIAGVTQPGGFPETAMPEVAFIGRSNVGKSSLINSLFARKTLARTSKTPGCTRQINFFQIGDRFFLADLPGYGYARVSHNEKNRWGELATSYLKKRPTLCRVFLLIDGRHALKDSDVMMMDLLGHLRVPYDVVLTKEDKATQSSLEAATLLIQKRHAGTIYQVSARKKMGLGLMHTFLLGL